MPSLISVQMQTQMWTPNCSVDSVIRSHHGDSEYAYICEIINKINTAVENLRRELCTLKRTPRSVCGPCVGKYSGFNVRGPGLSPAPPPPGFLFCDPGRRFSFSRSSVSSPVTGRLRHLGNFYEVSAEGLPSQLQSCFEDQVRLFSTKY